MAEASFRPIAIVLQVTPIIALAPLFQIWAGIDHPERAVVALACVAALHSPETGIIDSHRYMLALQGDMEDAGAVLALQTPVERLKLTPAGWAVRFGGAQPGSQ